MIAPKRHQLTRRTGGRVDLDDLSRVPPAVLSLLKPETYKTPPPTLETSKPLLAIDDIITNNLNVDTNMAKRGLAMVTFPKKGTGVTYAGIKNAKPNIKRVVEDRNGVHTATNPSTIGQNVMVDIPTQPHFQPKMEIRGARTSLKDKYSQVTTSAYAISVISTEQGSNATIPLGGRINAAAHNSLADNPNLDNAKIASLVSNAKDQRTNVPVQSGIRLAAGPEIWEDNLTPPRDQLFVDERGSYMLPNEVKPVYYDDDTADDAHVWSSVLPTVFQNALIESPLKAPKLHLQYNTDYDMSRMEQRQVGAVPLSQVGAVRNNIGTATNLASVQLGTGFTEMANWNGVEFGLLVAGGDGLYPTDTNPVTDASRIIKIGERKFRGIQSGPGIDTFEVDMVEGTVDGVPVKGLAGTELLDIQQRNTFKVRFSPFGASDQSALWYEGGTPVTGSLKGSKIVGFYGNESEECPLVISIEGLTDGQTIQLNGERTLFGVPEASIVQDSKPDVRTRRSPDDAAVTTLAFNGAEFHHISRVMTLVEFSNLFDGSAAQFHSTSQVRHSGLVSLGINGLVQLVKAIRRHRRMKRSRHARHAGGTLGAMAADSNYTRMRLRRKLAIKKLKESDHPAAIEALKRLTGQTEERRFIGYKVGQNGEIRFLGSTKYNSPDTWQADKVTLEKRNGIACAAGGSDSEEEPIPTPYGLTRVNESIYDNEDYTRHAGRVGDFFRRTSKRVRHRIGSALSNPYKTFHDIGRGINYAREIHDAYKQGGLKEAFGQLGEVASKEYRIRHAAGRFRTRKNGLLLSHTDIVVVQSNETVRPPDQLDSLEPKTLNRSERSIHKALRKNATNDPNRQTMGVTTFPTVILSNTGEPYATQIEDLIWSNEPVTSVDDNNQSQQTTYRRYEILTKRKGTNEQPSRPIATFYMSSDFETVMMVQSIAESIGYMVMEGALEEPYITAVSSGVLDGNSFLAATCLASLLLNTGDLPITGGIEWELEANELTAKVTDVALLAEKLNGCLSVGRSLMCPYGPHLDDLASTGGPEKDIDGFNRVIASPMSVLTGQIQARNALIPVKTITEAALVAAVMGTSGDLLTEHTMPDEMRRKIAEGEKHGVERQQEIAETKRQLDSGEIGPTTMYPIYATVNGEEVQLGEFPIWDDAKWSEPSVWSFMTTKLNVKEEKLWRLIDMGNAQPLLSYARAYLLANSTEKKRAYKGVGRRGSAKRVSTQQAYASLKGAIKRRPNPRPVNYRNPGPATQVVNQPQEELEWDDYQQAEEAPLTEERPITYEQQRRPRPTIMEVRETRRQPTQPGPSRRGLSRNATVRPSQGSQRLVPRERAISTSNRGQPRSEDPYSN